MEAIATLDPDLILGITSGMTEDEYRLLSQIAPTVPQPGEFVDYGVPWREEVRIIGRALGMDDRAEEIIADVEAQFARVREEHPEFAGKTAAVAFYFNDQPGAYSSQDTRSRLMTELGFVIPEQFDQIAGDLFYFTVSAEQMSVLDTDVIAWLASTDQGLATIRQLPLRSQLRASAEGREVFVDVVVGGAFGFSSPLSIPYVLEHLVPKLAAAVDGDPATPVD
jgi:iron complex transport system substrate-binding protein